VGGRRDGGVKQKRRAADGKTGRLQNGSEKENPTLQTAIKVKVATAHRSVSCEKRDVDWVVSLCSKKPTKGCHVGKRITNRISADYLGRDFIRLGTGEASVGIKKEEKEELAGGGQYT